jgi:hypothetical protein
MADGGRIVSLDSAGNVNYDSFNIEPDVTGGNLNNYQYSQAIHYRGVNKNQYRVSIPLSGQTNPTVMLSANYLQRTPYNEQFLTYPVWEYHKINSTCLAVCKDSNANDALYTGWSDGKIYLQDTGTNDNGNAIDYKMSLGWIRCADTADKTAIARRLIQYFAPLGNWNYSLQTNFDFGSSGGQIYSVKNTVSGDTLDNTFVLDSSRLAGVNPLVRIINDVYGAYSFAEFVWGSNVLDQVMQMHTIVLQPIQIEGFRSQN